MSTSFEPNSANELILFQRFCFLDITGNLSDATDERIDVELVVIHVINVARFETMRGTPCLGFSTTSLEGMSIGCDASATVN